jgi:hypothetical protein
MNKKENQLYEQKNQLYEQVKKLGQYRILFYL